MNIVALTLSIIIILLALYYDFRHKSHMDWPGTDSMWRFFYLYFRGGLRQRLSVTEDSSGPSVYPLYGHEWTKMNIFVEWQLKQKCRCWKKTLFHWGFFFFFFFPSYAPEGSVLKGSEAACLRHHIPTFRGNAMTSFKMSILEAQRIKLPRSVGICLPSDRGSYRGRTHFTAAYPPQLHNST